MKICSFELSHKLAETSTEHNSGNCHPNESSVAVPITTEVASPVAPAVVSPVVSPLDPRLADLLVPVVLEDITAGNIAEYLEPADGAFRAKKQFRMYTISYAGHTEGAPVLTLSVGKGAVLTLVSSMSVSTTKAIKTFTINKARVIHDGTRSVVGDYNKWIGVFSPEDIRGLPRTTLAPR